MTNYFFENDDTLRQIFFPMKIRYVINHHGSYCFFNRLKVEKIASDQANLENKEMAVLAISLLFASLAIFKLISSRVSAFMRASQGDKVGRANRGWVLILVSSTMTIFITLLSG